MANKYLDYDGLLYFWNKLKAKFVAQETGKGLSTNDYTTAEKNKLAAIEASADVNTIETVKVYGTALTPDASKAVNVAPDSKDIPYTYGGSSEEAATADNVSDALDDVWVSVVDLATELDNAETIIDNKIPKKTSQLTNDSNFVSDANYVHTDSNYTAAEKTKLAGIAEGATVDDKTWNGVTLDKTRAVGVSGGGGFVPYLDQETSSTSNLIKVTRDSDANTVAFRDGTGNFKIITKAAGDNSKYAATTEFVNTAINNAISGITGIQFEVVASLPAEGATGTIYLVSHSHGTQDIYDEYIWLSSSSTYKKIGSTDIDLSGYMLKTDMVAITNTEIDTVIATA